MCTDGIKIILNTVETLILKLLLSGYLKISIVIYPNRVNVYNFVDCM